MRGAIFWGIALIVLGGLFLLETLGLMPTGINVWSIFWPLALIAFGISALIGAFRPAAREAQALRLGLEGACSGWVKVSHGAGELMIDDRAGPDELVNGSFGGGVEHRLRRDGDEAGVELRPLGKVVTFGGPGGWRGYDWTVGLNPEIPYRLEVEAGANRSRLDLTNLKVNRLRLETGASATEIDLPARAGHTAAVIKAGAASVNVRIPPGVAARIHATGGLASINVDLNRFARASGSEYRSADYDTAENRVDLDIETGAGSVRVS